MHLSLLVVAVGVVTVCEGHIIGQNPSGRSPAMGHHLGRPNNNGHPHGNSKNGHQHGHNNGHPHGSPGDPPPRNAPLFNPCLPNPCYEHEPAGPPDYPNFERRRIFAGKWLKIKKKPFNPNLEDDAQYSALNAVFTDKAMKFAVPAVMQIDVLADNAVRYIKYKTVVRESMARLSEAYQTFKRTVEADRTKFDAMKTHFNATRELLKGEAKLAYANYAKTFKMTLFSYLNPAYQVTKGQTTSAETPPVQTSATVAIVDEPHVDLYVRVFRNRGLMMAPDLAMHMSSYLNITAMSTFYVANYANGFCEMWFCIDQTKPACL